MTTTPPVSTDDDALSYEETHVHSVYESIASHFSSTRYKVGPFGQRSTRIDKHSPGPLSMPFSETWRRVPSVLTLAAAMAST